MEILDHSTDNIRSQAVSSIVYDVFISYSHKDEVFAAALEKALLKHALSSFFNLRKKRLFAQDVAKLDTDERIFKNKATLQQEKQMAKRWLRQ